MTEMSSITWPSGFAEDKTPQYHNIVPKWIYLAKYVLNVTKTLQWKIYYNLPVAELKHPHNFDCGVPLIKSRRCL